MKPVYPLFLLFLSSFLFAQPPGTLDPTFGTGGKVVTSIGNGADQAHSLAIQTDGKIVVAGVAFSSVTGNDFVCLRYLSDGSLDSTFGTAGVATNDLQLGSDDIAYSVAIQIDGKIVVGGLSDNGSNQNAALVRYNTDGTLDNTFGTGGIVLTDFENSQSDEIRVVKIHQLTGNIIVGGSTILSSTVSKGVVARYTSNGTLDPAFDSNGIRTLWVTSLDYQYMWSVEDLVVQSNGKVSAVGWREFINSSWDSDFWALRINSDGTMDNTFSTDGVAIYNGNFNGHDRTYSMILSPNNNFRVAGGSYVSTLKYDFRVFEINASGTVGTWARSVDYGSTKDDIAYGMAEDNNGNYILGGTSGNASSSEFAVSRLTSGAAMDNTFGSSGTVTTTFGNAINECRAVQVQSDNKIVAAGWTGDDIAVVRFLGDGVAQLDDFQLTSPSNNAIDRNYTGVPLDWTDAYGATSYEVELDTTAGFTGTPQTFTTSSSNRSVTNLIPLTAYYWRVRASDGTNFGQWTSGWKFTTKTDLAGIEGSLLPEGLNLYPNPNTGTFYLDISPDWNGKSFVIRDLMGKEIQKGQLQGSPASFDLSDQLSGIYLLEIGNSVLKVIKE